MEQNKDISNRLNAWFLFFGSDDPEDIVRLIETYPDFQAMYQQILPLLKKILLCKQPFSKLPN